MPVFQRCLAHVKEPRTDRWIDKTMKVTAHPQIAVSRSTVRSRYRAQLWDRKMTKIFDNLEKGTCTLSRFFTVFCFAINRWNHRAPYFRRAWQDTSTRGALLLIAGNIYIRGTFCRASLFDLNSRVVLTLRVESFARRWMYWSRSFPNAKVRCTCSKQRVLAVCREVMVTCVTCASRHRVCAHQTHPTMWLVRAWYLNVEVKRQWETLRFDWRILSCAFKMASRSHYWSTLLHNILPHDSTFIFRVLLFVGNFALGVSPFFYRVPTPICVMIFLAVQLLLLWPQKLLDLMSKLLLLFSIVVQFTDWLICMSVSCANDTKYCIWF